MDSFLFKNVTQQNDTTMGTIWKWDKEFEEMIHPFWRKFEPVPQMHHILVGIYIGLVGIFGVLGNILVLYIFGTTRSLRTPPNLFIMNLAVSDLTFSAVNGFPLFTISSFNQRWAWGKLTCEIYGFIGGLFGLASVNVMALIALDRYFVIAQPIQQLRALTTRRAIGMVTFGWIYATIFAVPPFFGYGSYIPEGFQTSCTFDYLSRDIGNILFNVGMYLFAFMLPVLLIIFCYYKIVKAVRNHELEMMRLARKLNAKNPAALKTGDKKADVQAAKTSIMIIFFYLLSWSPYAIIALMALTGSTTHLNPYTSVLPVLFAKTSAMYNPIIYSISHPKFRVQLEKKFPWLMFCCPTKEKEREMASKAKARSDKESSMSALESDIPAGGAMEMKKTGSENNAYTEESK